MEKIVAILVIVNICLSAASAALHKLVEAFPGLKSADSIGAKAVVMLQKLVDLLSANVAHPAAPAPAPAPAPAVEAPAQEAPKA